MMLLADALLALEKSEAAKIGIREPGFCEKQKNLEIALAKIRCLAEFLSPSKSNGLLKIADSAFGGTPDRHFQKGLFDRISKHVSHLHEQRWMKGQKYPRIKTAETLKAGREILAVLKPNLEKHHSSLKGDAKHWWSTFLELYGGLELDR